MLISTLPVIKDFQHESEGGYITYSGFDDVLIAGLAKLREITANCPACILAALRQSGWASFAGKDMFDFKKELEEFWKTRNIDVSHYMPVDYD